MVNSSWRSQLLHRRHLSISVVRLSARQKLAIDGNEGASVEDDFPVCLNIEAYKTEIVSFVYTQFFLLGILFLLASR